MQYASPGAMVARINTAFLTEECLPTFKVSMVLFAICKQPAKLRISLRDGLLQAGGKGAVVFREAYLSADRHMCAAMHPQCRHEVADLNTDNRRIHACKCICICTCTFSCTQSVWCVT